MQPDYITAALQMIDFHALPPTVEPSPGFDLNLAETAITQAIETGALTVADGTQVLNLISDIRQRYITVSDVPIIRSALQRAAVAR
jgi:hypothetical protein